MDYCISKNVVVTFEKNRIIFLKGVWHPILFEVSKSDYKHCWNKVNDLFHQISDRNQSVSLSETEDHAIIQLFAKLVNINIVYVKINLQQLRYLICSEHTHDFLNQNISFFPQIQKLEFLNVDELQYRNLENMDNFLVICNNCSLLKIREINEKIINLKKMYCLLILKSDFFHIMFHNSPKSPCFECYYDYMISQIDNESYFDFFKIKNVNSETDENNSERLNYALAFVNLLLGNKYFFEDEKISHKLISFHFLTLELNVTNLLKKTDCLVCHQ